MMPNPKEVLFTGIKSLRRPLYGDLYEVLEYKNPDDDWILDAVLLDIRDKCNKIILLISDYKEGRC